MTDDPHNWPLIGWLDETQLWGTDDDLPGAWSKSDFEGGDPDERSYAARGWITPEDQLIGAGFAHDYAFPQRFMAGINPDGHPTDQIVVAWRSPTRTFSIANVDPDTLAILFGQPIIPLCQRQIPAEGTE